MVFGGFNGVDYLNCSALIVTFLLNNGALQGRRARPLYPSNSCSCTCARLLDPSTNPLAAQWELEYLKVRGAFPAALRAVIKTR